MAVGQTPDGRSGQEHWHLDKRVPMALIFAIVLQTAGAFWWASKVDATQAAMDKRLEKIENFIQSRSSTDSRIVALEIHLQNIKAAQERASDKLEVISEKLEDIRRDNDQWRNER